MGLLQFCIIPAVANFKVWWCTAEVLHGVTRLERGTNGRGRGGSSQVLWGLPGALPRLTSPVPPHLLWQATRKDILAPVLYTADYTDLPVWTRAQPVQISARMAPCGAKPGFLSYGLWAAPLLYCTTTDMAMVLNSCGQISQAHGIGQPGSSSFQQCHWKHLGVLPSFSFPFHHRAALLAEVMLFSLLSSV